MRYGREVPGGRPRLMPPRLAPTRLFLSVSPRHGLNLFRVQDQEQFDTPRELKEE